MPFFHFAFLFEIRITEKKDIVEAYRRTTFVIIFFASTSFPIFIMYLLLLLLCICHLYKTHETSVRIKSNPWDVLLLLMLLLLLMMTSIVYFVFLFPFYLLASKWCLCFAFAVHILKMCWRNCQLLISSFLRSHFAMSLENFLSFNQHNFLLLLLLLWIYFFVRLLETISCCQLSKLIRRRFIYSLLTVCSILQQPSYFEKRKYFVLRLIFWARD